jgi:rod shape-determining protein MreD
VSRGGTLGPATVLPGGNEGPSWPSMALYLVLLLVGIGLQATMASQLRLAGGQPDFLLTLALCTALLTDASTGATAGFVSGLMTAAMTSETMGTYLVTRTVAAWAIGALRKRFVRAGIVVTLLGVGLGSVLAGALYGLSAPKIGLGSWFALTFVGAGFNVLISLPIALVLQWRLRG